MTDWQFTWRDEADRSTRIVDHGARLRWRITDAQLCGYAKRRLPLAHEPEHVQRFILRWLPEFAKHQRWINYDGLAPSE